MSKLSVLVLFFMIFAPSLAAPQETTSEASNASAEQATSSAVISGVPALQFGKGMDCTFFGALNACLRHLGEQVSYEYLMGVSGAAFATRFRTDWSPTSADAALNDDHVRPALKAIGYGYEWVGSGMPNASEIAMASVSGGVPIIAARPLGYADWGLIVGYKLGGDVWLCRTYHDKSNAYTEITNLPPSMLILGEKRVSIGQADAVKRSIKLALEFAKGEKKLSDSRFEVGIKAYEAWVRALQSQDLQRLTASELERVAHTNAWLYSCLIDARSAGVAYLRWAQKIVSDEAKDAVGEIADLYEQEVRILKDAQQYVPYPSQLRDGKTWTSEMRDEQAKALKSAAEKEKEAIALLEKVVSVVEMCSDSNQGN